MQSNPLLEAALRYADNGWQVFPLYGIVEGHCECNTQCGSPGKHPRTPRGFQNASDDAETIRGWWSRWPRSNIGIATGAVSGIYVIDVDNKRSIDIGNGVLVGEGEHSLRVKSREIGDLPETLTSRTGSGGLHLIFTYPTVSNSETAGSLGNRAGILSSVDTRGDGGYIAAPPSLHQSGVKYQWVDPYQSLASLPLSWLTWITSSSGTLSKPSLSLEIPEGFQVRAGEGRHDWLFRMGAKLRGQHGLEAVALYGALQAYNRRVLDPPLEPREVEHIVESCVTKYEAGLPPPPVDTSEMVPTLLEGDDLAESLYDFMMNEPEPLKPLVAQLLNSGECMVLGGQPNIGKTWAVMDMMLGISSGSQFARHFACEQTPVLFIDEEGSRRGDWDRFNMLLSGRDESAVRFPLYTKIDSGIKLDDPRGLAAISRLIERYRPGAVFLDSLVRMHGRDEGNNREMSRFFATIKRFMVNYGTAFVFTHHVRKPSAESSQDPIWMLRGASDIQGFPDSIAIFLPGAESAEVEVVHTKMRNGPKMPNFNLRIQVDDEQKVAKIGYLEHDPLSHTNQVRNSILNAIRTAPGMKASTEMIAATTGLAMKTVTEHTKVLAAMQAVESKREGGFYYHQIPMEEAYGQV